MMRPEWVTAPLDGPGMTVSDPRELLLGYLARWLRWGFAAEDVTPWPPGGDAEEFAAGGPAESVLAAYDAEVRRSREIVAGAALTDVARLGGRFTDSATAPPLARILFHLLQEYARHAGHLDVARELLDGVTGE